MRRRTFAKGRMMDINTVTDVVRRPPQRPGIVWRAGDAWLAGGSWIFSEKQPDIKRLLDLEALKWDALRASDAGLEIGATCTIAQLHAFQRPDWRAAPLFATC